MKTETSYLTTCRTGGRFEILSFDTANCSSVPMSLGSGMSASDSCAMMGAEDYAAIICREPNVSGVAPLFSSLSVIILSVLASTVSLLTVYGSR